MPTGARGAATPFGQFWAQFAKSPGHAQNHAFGGILVVSGLLNLYTKFHQYWKKYG